MNESPELTPPRPLDYGTQTTGVRRSPIVAVVCAIVFALVGLAIGRVVGNWSVYYSTTSIINWNAPAGAATPTPQQAATQMESQGFIAASLKASGSTVALTPAEVAADLAVLAVPSSSLLEITSVDHDPQRSFAVTSTMVNAAMRINPTATILEPPRAGAPLRHPLPGLIGLVFGAIVGGILPFLWLPFRRRR